MGKIGRPAAMILEPGDRERAAENIARLVREWKLTADEIGKMLGAGAGVVSAVRHARPVASSVMVARALALGPSDLARCGILEQRQRRTQMIEDNIARMVAHARSFKRQPAPASEPADKPANPDDPDIPFV